MSARASTTPPGLWVRITAALVLDLVALSAWLLAYFGPFPPHPWIWLLFAGMASIAGAAGIVIAVVVFHRWWGRSWRGVALMGVGVASFLPVLIDITSLLTGLRHG